MADLDQLKQAHDDIFTSTERLAHGLPREAWDRRTGCPGWSVRDILAHMVGLEALLAGEQEPEVEIPDRPHIRDDGGRYMERHVEARRTLPIDDLLDEMDDIFARRRRAIADIGDLGEEIPGIGGRSAAAAGILTIRVFDLYAHEQDIRRAVGEPGHEAGPATDVTLRRIVRGLAHYLPQRVEGMGGTLLVDVVGRPDDAFALDLVSGDVLEPRPDEPTVALRPTWSQLVALTCGRADAPGRGEVDADGPDPLLTRVVAGLAVTP